MRLCEEGRECEWGCNAVIPYGAEGRGCNRGAGMLEVGTVHCATELHATSATV